MVKKPKQFLSSRWLISSQLNVDFVFLQSIPNPLSLFVHLSSLLLRSVELMPSKWGLVMDRLLVLSRRFSDSLSKVQVFLWRLLELHILKMVAFFSVWVALDEVKAGGDGCCVREMTETNCTHMILFVSIWVYWLWPLFVRSRLWWTWSWWCCGLWRCPTVASGPWHPVFLQSGCVSSSCVRCCTSSVSSTLLSTPVPVTR